MADQRLDRLEKEVGSLSTGQQELQKGQEKMMKQMEDMLATIGTRLTKSKDSKGGEGEGESFNRDKGKSSFRHELGHSTAPKLAKLDFPRAGKLSEAQQIGGFVSGLRENIRTSVQASRPTSLTAAVGLARLFEAYQRSQRHLTITDTKKIGGVGPSFPPLPSPSLTRA
ncbi:hypothetical protein EZV62_004806 [Acer yangbiense]|uniref:Uncharacterized protein n=1 Tax=Acer yangbiense TaxID=1000413 RepID=A0A5C7IKY8_9ROSI|nr:hypothetical protein EZV62_004806 [Acer yangbiense]